MNRPKNEEVPIASRARRSIASRQLTRSRAVKIEGRLLQGRQPKSLLDWHDGHRVAEL
jgi:hypothetical protein